MVSASTQLIAYLQAGYPFFGADLFTFTLLDGTVFYATSFDRNISYGGHLYLSSPYMKRTSIKLSTGLQASTMNMTIVAMPTFLVEGNPILLLIAQGRFVGATVSVRRAFMTVGDLGSFSTSTAICNLTGAPTGSGDGTILRFVGQIGEVQEVTPTSATIEVRDQLYLLNRPLPRNVYWPSCWHTLFDAGCTLNATSFQVSSTVQSGSNFLVIQTSLTNDNHIPGGPVNNVALTAVANPGNVKTLPFQACWCVVTYLTAYGETVASPESSLGINPGFVAQAASPPSVTGATGWNCYMGDASGNEQLQNVTPIAIGTHYQYPAEGMTTSGVLPPTIPTTGYWALGRIEFTSGVLEGYSAGISASAPNGSGGSSITLVVPMPVAPNTGDSYVIQPGCDKAYTTCNSKYSNLIHFSGFPAVPTPEVGTG